MSPWKLVWSFPTPRGLGVFAKLSISLNSRKAFQAAAVRTAAQSTYGGGNGAGTVYKLTHQSSGWTLDPISTFAGGGANPYAGVVFGPNGSLYGTTTKGSLHGGNGTVFNLSPSPTVCKTVFCPWMETLLYAFQGSPHGYGPGLGDLTFDQEGNIYGIVYELKPSGGVWTETVLHTFGYGDGAYPYSRVIFDNAGNLYGTTWGGAQGDGTVFEMTYTVGSGWTIPFYTVSILQATGAIPMLG